MAQHILLYSLSSFGGMILDVQAFFSTSAFNCSSMSCILISLREKNAFFVFLLILIILGCLEYFRIVASMGSSILGVSVMNSPGMSIFKDAITFEKKLLKVLTTSISSDIISSFSTKIMAVLWTPLSEKKRVPWFSKTVYYRKYICGLSTHKIFTFLSYIVYCNSYFVSYMLFCLHQFSA